MASPVRITFGDYPIQTRVAGEYREVLDPIRRKWVALTPEEWVRQNWIHWLQARGFPGNRMKAEHTLQLLGQLRRADLVVFDEGFRPWMIVECKAPDVPVGQAVFDQIARYNMALKVPYLIVTNGKLTYCCEINHSKRAYQFLDHIPRPG